MISIFIILIILLVVDNFQFHQELNKLKELKKSSPSRGTEAVQSSIVVDTPPYVAESKTHDQPHVILKNPYVAESKPNDQPHAYVHVHPSDVTDGNANMETTRDELSTLLRNEAAMTQHMSLMLTKLKQIPKPKVHKEPEITTQPAEEKPGDEPANIPTKIAKNVIRTSNVNMKGWSMTKKPITNRLTIVQSDPSNLLKIGETTWSTTKSPYSKYAENKHTQVLRKTKKRPNSVFR